MRIADIHKWLYFTHLLTRTQKSWLHNRHIILSCLIDVTSRCHYVSRCHTQTFLESLSVQWSYKTTWNQYRATHGQSWPAKHSNFSLRLISYCLSEASMNIQTAHIHWNACVGHSIRASWLITQTWQWGHTDIIWNWGVRPHTQRVHFSSCPPPPPPHISFSVHLIAPISIYANSTTNWNTGHCTMLCSSHRPIIFIWIAQDSCCLYVNCPGHMLYL